MAGQGSGGTDNTVVDLSQRRGQVIVALLTEFYQKDDPPEVLPFIKRYLIFLQTEGAIEASHPVQEIFSRVSRSVVQSFDHLGRLVSTTSTEVEIDSQIDMARWHLNIARSQAYLEITDTVNRIIKETRKYVVNIQKGTIDKDDIENLDNARERARIYMLNCFRKSIPGGVPSAEDMVNTIKAVNEQQDILISHLKLYRSIGARYNPPPIKMVRRVLWTRAKKIWLRRVGVLFTIIVVTSILQAIFKNDAGIIISAGIVVAVAENIVAGFFYDRWR